MKEHIIKYKDLLLEEDETCSDVMDYVMLTKPRVMSLVVFSSITGLLIAPGHIHPFIGLVAILCIVLGCGSAAALNMWYDRDIDAIMARTQKRPIVTGKIKPEDALSFAVILGFFAVVIMAVCVSYVASLLLLITILFYYYVYTVWLKRSSVQNIVIGGAAGAFPPMIGWAAVTGDVSLDSFLLFLIIFLWTPPHFWALALYKSEDYRKTNIPMMPVVMGDDYTKKQIVIYTALTVLASMIPVFVDMSSFIYGVLAAGLGSFFLYYAIALLPDKDNLLAPRLFFFSILYLFLIFIFMIMDHYLKG